ncbi:MAG TPA: N-acetylmuramoyl-L-alanine amidase [Xanthomonadales bacterium]|nr:N-acetylmuramoyl-L-alanine amidase [Xanthomonadales bacterium]
MGKPSLRWFVPMLALALLALLALALVATHAPERNPLATWVPSPNHGARRPILIVLHATEQDSVEQSLETLRTRNSTGPVSAHYLIGRDGAIYQLVADDRRAWHAGPGRWGTITDVNSASIGIELDNDGVADFPQPQLDALLRLMDELCTRLDIPRYQVIAHADMAPTRKRDPSARFPWAALAQAGFGPWPSGPLQDPPEGFDPWLALRALGYTDADRDAALRAFQRRFRGIEAALDAPPPAMGAEDALILHALTRR